MGNAFNQIEQAIRDVQHWFQWVAIALAVLVVINLVSASFVVWGMLRIAKLAEINQFPRNPADPQQALLFGGFPAPRP